MNHYIGQFNQAYKPLISKECTAAEHFALWKLERIDLKILTFERWFPTPSSWLKPPTLYTIIYNSHSNLDLVNKSVRPFLFTISNNSLNQM